MTDIEQGREAVRHFHNASLKYDDYQPESLDDLLALYGKKRDIYLDGIGMVIRENGMNPYTVEGAMSGLARSGQGKIPKDHQGYIAALGKQAVQINWLDLTKNVAVETATTVAQGTVSFGNQVRTSLSWLNTLLPFLAVGGVIFYIYSFSKNNSTVSREARAAIKEGIKKARAAVKRKKAA